jgi:hypothetical protein
VKRARRPPVTWGRLAVARAAGRAVRGRRGRARPRRADPVADGRRRRAQVPHHPERRQGAQRVVGHVDLPPEPPLVRRRLVVVVVVVPALAQGDERDEEVVARGVGGVVAPPPDDVGEGVHEERPVPEEDGGDEVPPEEEREAADRPQRGRVGGGRHEVIAVEPAKLGVAGEVAHPLELRRVVAAGHDPAHVAPPEAALHGRVDVVGPIGPSVVVAMMGRPPERPLLRRRPAEEGEEELEPPVRPVRSVREVAVVTRRDTEHADQVAGEREREERPGEGAQRDRRDRGQVDGQEGDRLHPVDAAERGALSCWRWGHGGLLHGGQEHARRLSRARHRRERPIEDSRRRRERRPGH